MGGDHLLLPRGIRGTKLGFHICNKAGGRWGEGGGRRGVRRFKGSVREMVKGGVKEDLWAT